MAFGLVTPLGLMVLWSAPTCERALTDPGTRAANSRVDTAFPLSVVWNMSGCFGRRVRVPSASDASSHVARVTGAPSVGPRLVAPLHARSKFGRRRPFIFAAAFFVPTAIALGWTPSLVSPGIAASLWYGAFHIMYKLADTLLLIPLEAWGAQLTPVYKESTSVWTTRKLMGDFGIIVGIAVVPFFFVTRPVLWRASRAPTLRWGGQLCPGSTHSRDSRCNLRRRVSPRSSVLCLRRF